MSTAFAFACRCCHSLLNQHRHLVAMTVPTYLSHLIDADVSHTNECVSVHAGSTWGRRVVKVDKSEELLIVLGDALNVLEGLDSSSKDVTGIHADAEARVLELEHELNEVRYVGERL